MLRCYSEHCRSPLSEMVDFDPEHCCPSKYYRYMKLKKTKPQAAQVLKSYALMSIRDRQRSGKGDGEGATASSSRKWSSLSVAATNITRRAHALTEGTITGARSMFSIRSKKSEEVDDPVKDAIIAAKEAVEKTKPRRSLRSSATSGWAAMRSFGK